MRMMRKNNSKNRQDAGFSMIEILVVMTIVGILTAIAVPQLIVQRRLTRSAAVTREIMTQMRYARQLAMSQSRATPTGALRRVAFTFQYDDATKQVKIIGPIPSGTAALIDTLYPNNTGSSVIVSDPLTQGGLTSTEISYGIPTVSTGLPTGAPTIPVGALDDGVSPTALASNKVNITFQPDGSVIDLNGAPLDRAVVLYNNKAAQATASAISVIGASGRVKVWRYSVGANKFIE
jgi:prepilin-type N-terminal cleavage/methylation domain-containing protein